MAKDLDAELAKPTSDDLAAEQEDQQEQKKDELALEESIEGARSWAGFRGQIVSVTAGAVILIGALIYLGKVGVYDARTHTRQAPTICGSFPNYTECFTQPTRTPSAAELDR